MLGKGLESLIPKKQNIQSSPLPTHAYRQAGGKQEQDQQTNQQLPKEADNFRATTPTERPAEGADAFRAEALGVPPSLVSDEVGIGGTRAQGGADRWSRRTPGSGRKASAPDSIFYIETEKIKPNPHQPRRDFNEESLRELANSIREHGILQPLIVSKIEKETDFGAQVEYQLIAGERRLRAAQIAGLESVPVIIKNIIKDAEHLEMAIVENLQRADLNPVETARAYAKLQDVFGLTQREIAQRLGKSRETIANTLRLLNLPTEIQEAVAKNQINESQARLLLMIDDQIQRQNLFKEIISNNLSVRELRGRIRGNKQLTTDDQQQSQRQISVNPEILNFQEQLAELLGAKVKIKPFGNTQGKGGEIIIDFYSAEEIEGIIKKLSPENNLWT